MAHPYEQFEGTPLWETLNKGINDLVENSDIEETTRREYIPHGGFSNVPVIL